MNPESMVKYIRYVFGAGDRSDTKNGELYEG